MLGFNSYPRVSCETRWSGQAGMGQKSTAGKKKIRKKAQLTMDGRVLARWWFQTFFIFTPTWANDAI